MIKLKSLIENIETEIDEASEDLYGIRKQPADTCPLINAIQGEAKKLANIMRGYKKLNGINDIEKLHDILWEVEYFLDNNIIGGSECALERVRDNIENIRAWGQEWKTHAKEVDPKVPEHQQPQNLPKWGSLT